MPGPYFFVSYLFVGPGINFWDVRVCAHSAFILFGLVATRKSLSLILSMWECGHKVLRMNRRLRSPFLYIFVYSHWPSISSLSLIPFMASVWIHIRCGTVNLGPCWSYRYAVSLWLRPAFGPKLLFFLLFLPDPGFTKKKINNHPGSKVKRGKEKSGMNAEMGAWTSPTSRPITSILMPGQSFRVADSFFLAHTPTTMRPWLVCGQREKKNKDWRRWLRAARPFLKEMAKSTATFPFLFLLIILGQITSLLSLFFCTGPEY